MSARWLGLAVGAGLALLGLWLWLGRAPADIGGDEAQARAERMLAAYVARSGEPSGHFTAMARIEYPEGWEFNWRYAPCPQTARMSIFIRRSGSGHYGETPDCHPMRGLATPPQQV